jgi:hypothetical protein
MSYNDLEISVIFDNLWEIYPSNERPAAAKKALKVALKTGMDDKEFEKAVRIYALENEGAEFHYHFVNFINDEHWKDILSYHKNAQEHIKLLEDRRKLARSIISEWNDSCRSHWCQCLDVELRIPIVVAALSNEPFRNEWKKALDIARKIFYHQQHDNDKFRNLSLSLRWFCTVAPADKHTVMRIIEGEYGKPHRNPVYKKEPDPLSENEREEIRSTFDEIFSGEEWFGKKKEEPKEKKYEGAPNKEMTKFVDALDGMIDDLGGEDDDEFEFT